MNPSFFTTTYNTFQKLLIENFRRFLRIQKFRQLQTEIDKRLGERKKGHSNCTGSIEVEAHLLCDLHDRGKGMSQCWFDFILAAS